VDGQHISTLLLTAVVPVMRPLIENGHVFLAAAAVVQAEVQRSEPEFAYSDRERDGLIEARQEAGRKINVEDGSSGPRTALR